MVILQKFGLLVVLCNHGKHRSLSLAIELANYTGCECVSIRSISSPLRYRPIHDVMKEIGDPFRRHCELFTGHPNPIIGIRVCVHPFNGTAWAQGEKEQDQKCNYFVLTNGDILVEVRCDFKVAQGWSLGYAVGGCGRPGWYPPEFVMPMPLPKRHFDGCRDLFDSLIPRYLPGGGNTL